MLRSSPRRIASATRPFIVAFVLALAYGCGRVSSNDGTVATDDTTSVDKLVGISPDVAGSSPRPFAVGAPLDTSSGPATPSELASLAASMIIPVQGVVAADLRDSYSSPRQGHVHEALDILAPRGTPVLSATDGRVLKLHQSVAGGNMVYAADASDRFILMYGHLDRYADGLADGMKLTRGQFIGYVGTTGNAPANRPHLHFAIARGHPSVAWWKGTAVNPFPLFVPLPVVAAADTPLVLPPAAITPQPAAAAPTPAPVVATPLTTPSPVATTRTTTAASVSHFELSSSEAKALVGAKAKLVLTALAAHDMAKVSSFVGTTGLRFSPYPHIDPKSDRLFRKSQVKALWTSKALSVWGTHDGSGAPIRLTYPEYQKSFVWDVNYARAAKVAFNADPIGRGNMVNNIAESYPSAIVVEYHVPGVDPKLDGMDWKSLWLVFEKTGSTWYLVGIVHGAWTI